LIIRVLSCFGNGKFIAETAWPAIHASKNIVICISLRAYLFFGASFGATDIERFYDRAWYDI
jgi:hypothetical protein